MDIQAGVPGVVARVFVAGGEHVNERDPICSVELMKMENVVTAPRPGLVAKVHVAPGDVVDVDTVVAELADDRYNSVRDANS